MPQDIFDRIAEKPQKQPTAKTAPRGDIFDRIDLDAIRKAQAEKYPTAAEQAERDEPLMPRGAPLAKVDPGRARIPATARSVGCLFGARRTHVLSQNVNVVIKSV